MPGIGSIAKADATSSRWSEMMARWFHAAKSGQDPQALDRVILRSCPEIPPKVRQCFLEAVTHKSNDPMGLFERYLDQIPAEQKQFSGTPPMVLPQRRQPSTAMRVRSDRALEQQLQKQRRNRLLGLAPIHANDLATIEWKKVGDVIHLAGGEGSTGVYLVEVAGKGVIVKPGSLSTAGEYFCSLLYKKAGMRVPRQRILLSKANGEFEKLRQAVSRGADLPGASEGKLRLKLELDKGACVAVVEYIKSKPIWELSRASEVDRQRLLNQIGKTMALDILVNNGDRLPFIHRGDGNPSNLLLCKHQEYADLLDVCLIDNNVQAILNAEGRDKYLEIVSNLSKEIFVGNLPPTKIHGMDAVARFLLIHADLQVDFDEAVAIMEGIQGGMREVVALCTLDPNMFKRMKHETVKVFQRTPGTMPVLKPGIDAIAEDFLQLVQIRFL